MPDKADAAEMIARMKAWISSFSADIQALQALVAEPKLDREARILASAALAYVITRLDLIPDWEEGAGVLDDAMVLRVAMAIAAEHDLEPLEDDAQRVVMRLANENEVVKAFLGDELYVKMRKYVGDLVNTVVRGRHPRVALDDEKVRQQVFNEVKDELKRIGPQNIKDPDAVARTVRNYLSHKLK